MTWQYVPKLACPSVRAAVASTWGLNLRNPDSAPPAMSNGNNTPVPFCKLVWQMGISTPRRSGQTCEPSTLDRGTTLSIPYLLDTPVSRFLPPVSARAQMMSGTCGPKSPASFANANPDGSSSKTSPDTFRLARIPCCESYGTWAGRLRLAYSQRLKQARRTSGCDGSAWPTATTEAGLHNRKGASPTSGDGLATAATSWPTPMAGTPAQNGNSAAGNNDFTRKAEALWRTPTSAAVNADRAASPDYQTKKIAKGQTITIADQVRMWQTPVSDDAPDRSRGKINSRGEPKLSGQAQQWGTPRSSDGEKGGPNMTFSSGGTPLPAQAANWPTPAAQNVKGSSPDSTTRADGKSRMDILHYAAEQGFTPPAQATQQHGPKLSQLRPIWRPLRRLVISTHGRHVWRRLMRGRDKRRLNPIFVELLMGWPPGHALCACSEMAFFHWQRRMRGELSQLPMTCGPWVWKPSVEAEPEQIEMF